MDSCSKTQPYIVEFIYIVFNNKHVFMKKKIVS